MDRELELQLIERCLALSENNTTQLATETSLSPVSRYLDPGRFELEQQRIFQQLPVPYAHHSQLPDTDSFITLNSAHGRILLTRDKESTFRAFLNVCRHRGTELESENEGNANRFSCPYHAWTYANTGELLAVPHAQQCFPDLDKKQLGLVEIGCEDKYGFLWLTPKPATLKLADPISNDLAWLESDSLEVFAQDRRVWQANWKLIAEGGLESYHFKYAHKETIAPYFMDNQSIYDCFDPHFRSVLPGSNLPSLKDAPKDQWSIRQASHLVYALFPKTTLLVETDHIVWIHANPLSIDRTEITVSTLIPSATKPLTDQESKHWRKNHQITTTTLNEDFLLAEKIQRGLSSGANTHLHFGCNESALDQLNTIIESYL